MRSRLFRWSTLTFVGALLAVIWALGCSPEETVKQPPPPPPPPPPTPVTFAIHYYRPVADYAGWSLSPTGDVAPNAAKQLAVDHNDEFGAVFSVPLAEGAKQISFTVQNGGVQDPQGALSVDLAQHKEVWVYSGSPRVYPAAPAIPKADTAIIYYRRLDGLYTGYGVHAWQDTTDMPTWDMPIQAAGADQFGTYFIVNLTPDPKTVNFIIHQGNNKDPGPDQALDLTTQGRRIWVLSSDPTIYTYPADPPLLDAVRAHWVAKDTIAWDLAGDDMMLSANTYALNYAASGGMAASDKGIAGGKQIALTYDKAGLSAAVKAKFPHLASYKALRMGRADTGKIGEALKSQILVSASRADTTLIKATGVQIPGVLDEVYTYKGALGVTFSAGVPSLTLWAPTARSVKAHIFDDPKAQVASKIVDLTENNGVWSVVGDATWKGKYYLYEVEVYVHATGKVEHNLVTDPYSLSLSANSARSQIIDLSDPTLAPPGFGALAKPPLASPADISIYELHVRDFSVNDPTVPAAHKGTFMAFTDAASSGMSHLKALAASGLTHVHLLPVFDLATVEEVKAKQQDPGDLSGFLPDSMEQQAAIAKVKDTDGFNWGYDPLHYTVPEGSYATVPDGTARVVEFRSMVKALNESGLRVVMDVVYNHTSASGQDPKSVLDRIVPGYYHRLDLKGTVETSTCCRNTATEHAMMEKLMVDSLVTWARAYKVDAFRFDLMGHHMKSNLVNVRAALDALTLAKDGVDGSSIYLYGEGWDFGEVAGNARGVNATQLNMAGTGVGTFNDRIRDAVRGGGPFDSGQDLKKQGFVSGLYYDPNKLAQGTPAEQQARLLLLSDQLRVGMAGNLKDYTFKSSTDMVVKGSDIDYNGHPTGYTAAPVEAINYVEAHDNQTLFDIFQFKAPDGTDMESRIRMQNLGVSLLLLGQGVPFFHAGVDMMRSKSMDRNSYNSGDWFNKLDFSYASNNWAVGLPPQDDNGNDWSVMMPYLTDPLRKPAKAHILRTVAHLQTMLKIRASSKLFRLETAADVMARVVFHNVGAAQLPGIVVMSISDEVAALPDLDPAIGGIVVVVNATTSDIMYADPAFNASVLALHPLQAGAPGDPASAAAFNAGAFVVPARVAAVFVGSLNLP